MSSAAKDQIDRNVRIHDRIATSYDDTHDEIFNDIEQTRLRDALARAAAAAATGSDRPAALDFGCGSGNLTRHLLALGFEVTAADVSEGFLGVVAERFAGQPVTTHRIGGEDLTGLADGAFDLVATYSVLHHVPDYLAAMRELARVTKPGGIVFVDHEHCPGHWRPDPAYAEFLRRGRRFDWRKFFVPHNYYGKLRRLLIDPKYSNEGDIHVWPDDHVEWDRIGAILAEAGFEPVFEEDYLVFRSGYREEVHREYRGRCADMRAAAWRKRG